MYVEIPFWRLMLALLVISIPAAALEQTGEARWARAYVGLILFIFLMANWSGVEAFSAFVRREVRM